MSPEDDHVANYKGKLSTASECSPFTTDKDALIPQEQFDVVLRGDRAERYHTIYLDPAYELEYIAPYAEEPRVRYAMYEASINLDKPWSFGRLCFEHAFEVAKKKTRNFNSPRYFEEFIKAYHNDQGLRLVHILSSRTNTHISYLLYG
jgi:hypothetical protein